MERQMEKTRDFQKPEMTIFNEILSIRKVTKVTSAKRMSFSVAVIVGDKKGMFGFGVGKAREKDLAIQKAVSQAKKNMQKIELTKKAKTIPHFVLAKYKAAKVMLKPGIAGSGIVAGGSIRKVLEIAGVENIVAKALGSSNPLVNALCTIKALNNLLPKRNV